MFKKPPPSPPKNLLADRVRQLGERRPTAPLTPPQATSNPRSPRRPLFRNATLILDSGLKLTVAIKDLSDAGARVEFFVKAGLDEGETVTLVESTMKLRRRARIVWERDGVAGLVFIGD